MAASSESMERQLLQYAQAQLTGYLSRWRKNYSHEVRQIMVDLSTEQNTHVLLDVARLFNALFAIPIRTRGSSLQKTRLRIGRLLLEVDDEGNNLLMLAGRDCPEAFFILLQVVNHLLFADKVSLFQQRNIHNQKLLDFIVEYNTSRPLFADCQTQEGKVALVRQIGAQLLSGDYQFVDTFNRVIRAYPKCMDTVLTELSTECNLQPDASNAMMLKAIMHQYGQGGPVNYPEAIRLYDRAIALGKSCAMNNRAYMYHHGDGGPVNYPKAIKLYDRAIALGDVHAMSNRAYMHQHGQGGPVNYPEARRLYAPLIALGKTSAMNNRAYMYQHGHGGPVNDSKAIKLYDRAIILGDSHAMCNRAYMHQHGRGGPVNYPEAIRLYRLSASLGNQSAVRSLERAIRLYSKDCLALQEESFTLSSSYAEAISLPLILELSVGDIAFVNQKIVDLVGVFCDTITGTIDSISLKLTISRYHIDMIRTLFESINAEKRIKFASTDGSNFQMTLKNVSLDDIRAFTIPERPEHESPDTQEATIIESMPSSYNKMRFWERYNLNEQLPAEQHDLKQGLRV